MRLTKELKIEMDGIEKIINVKIDINDEKYLYELCKRNFFAKYTVNDFVEMFESWLILADDLQLEYFAKCVNNINVLTWKNLVKEMAKDTDIINLLTKLCNEINHNIQTQYYFEEEIMAEILDRFNQGIDL